MSWAPHIMSVLTGLLVLLVVVLLMTRGKKTMLRASAAMFVAAFLGGFVLYTFAYIPVAPVPADIFEAMLRGLFSTGRMFLINDDYGFILDDPTAAWLVENNLLQIIFWACHVMALVVSVSALTGLFGRKLIDLAAMRLRSYDSRYIICGSDKRALALGENIATHDSSYGRTQPEEAPAEAGQMEPDSLGPLARVLARRRRRRALEATRPKRDGRRLVVFMDEEFSDEARESIGRMGAMALEYDERNFRGQLHRAGLGTASGKENPCRVVVMPQKTARAMSIAKDVLDCARDYEVPSDRLNLYVQSEGDWMDRRAADMAEKTPYSLHTFNEAELAARRLVLALPPAASLSFEGGRATRSLVVLVLGFGQTGRQTLRRLIMNGQFMGSSMRAIVVDKDLDQHVGHFQKAYPEINKCCDIEYHSIDVRSAAFYDILDAKRSVINYIVVALSDDGQNMETAQHLYDYYHQYTGDAQDAADVVPPMAVRVADSDTPGAFRDEGIVFFSQREDIYSEATLIREVTDNMAMAVNLVYETDGKDAPGGPTKEQRWLGISHFERESNRAAADFVPSALRAAGVRPEQLAGKRRMEVDADAQQMMAETEHLRWNAFHYAMGFVSMSDERVALRFEEMWQQKPPEKRKEDPKACRKDMEHKQHYCLDDWAGLGRRQVFYDKLCDDKEITKKPDFRGYDKRISEFIPLFLMHADGNMGETGRAEEEENG